MFTLKHILQPCDVLQDGSWKVISGVSIPRLPQYTTITAECVDFPIGADPVVVEQVLCTSKRATLPYSNYQGYLAAFIASLLSDNTEQQIAHLSNQRYATYLNGTLTIRYQDKYGIKLYQDGSQINQ